jgi:hypothetical protein
MGVFNSYKAAPQVKTAFLRPVGVKTYMFKVHSGVSKHGADQLLTNLLPP